MTTIDTNDFLSAVIYALDQLHDAAEELTKQTVPHTPLPRPRLFWITEHICWPYMSSDRPKWSHLNLDGRSYHMFKSNHTDLAQTICIACGWQPRKVLRAIRVIQNATRWCHNRIEGRRRAAEEIVKQQQRFYEGVLAEAAVSGLNP